MPASTRVCVKCSFSHCKVHCKVFARWPHLTKMANGRRLTVNNCTLMPTLGMLPSFETKQICITTGGNFLCFMISLIFFVLQFHLFFVFMLLFSVPDCKVITVGAGHHPALKSFFPHASSNEKWRKVCCEAGVLKPARVKKLVHSHF